MVQKILIASSTSNKNRPPARSLKLALIPHSLPGTRRCPTTLLCKGQIWGASPSWSVLQSCWGESEGDPECQCRRMGKAPHLTPGGQLPQTHSVEERTWQDLWLKLLLPGLAGSKWPEAHRAFKRALLTKKPNSHQSRSVTVTPRNVERHLHTSFLVRSTS